MIVAANLKTNLTRAATARYIEEVEKFVATNAITVETFVFPATTALDRFKTTVTIGAQNAYPVKNGAFTGEIGLEHLEEFGIQTILIGHSERRHILGETQEQIAAKFAFYKERGFTIVYCVGEPLAKRQEGNASMMEYIDAQYAGIDTEYDKLVIAYEPVWAIGTGLTPSSEDIASMHTALKEKSSAPLLYGGSVKVNNIEEILKVKNVDGVLVGSGALYTEHFTQMIACAQAQKLHQ